MFSLFLFFASLCLLFQFQPASSYPNSYLNGFEINELFTYDATVFLMEANLWTAVGLVDSTKRTYTCWGSPLLGGYKILSAGGYFERTYTNLPPHDAIYWKFKMPVLDKWVSPDTIIVEIGGKNFSTGDMSVFRPYTKTTYCASSAYNDLFESWEMGKIFHSGDSVTMRVISLSSRAPTLASFGIRDVTMFLVNKTADDVEMGCFGSSIKSVLTPNNCTCPVGKYANPQNSNECLSCDGSCHACFGPGADKCYGCKSGYSYVDGICFKCDSSCLACSGPRNNQCTQCSTSLWYTWDNRCNSTCESPYIQKVVGSTQICLTPCNSATEYFLWNGTCADNCTAPHLIAKTTEYGLLCELPCEDGEFLDWNGNCRQECESPLVAGNNSMFLTCDLPCDSGSFLYPNNTCHPTCELPFLQEVEEGGSLKRCYYPCTSFEEDYIYPNGSCLSVCDSPFISKMSDVIKVCDYPCDFEAGESLYYDGSCLSSCDSPHYERTQDNFTYCDPCVSGDYYYNNNSCHQNCPAPFTHSSQNGSLFCTNKCLPPTPVLKYDGSCIESCDSPFVYSGSDDDYKICSSPCEDREDYIYGNGSCGSSCEAPFTSKILNDVKRCLEPCYGTSDYYFNETETCSSECPSSYRNLSWGSIKICFEFTQDEILRFKKIAQIQAQVKPLLTISNVAQDGSTTGIILATIFGAYNPATATIAEFLKMLPYIRYMKIDYPARLQLLLDNMNSSVVSFSFGLKMSNTMTQKFNKDNELPENFEKYDLASSFLVNYWQTLTCLGIILAVVAIFTFLEKITRKKKTLNFFIARLNVICKWNYLLMMFCTNFDGVALYSSLEFRTIHLSSWPQVVSLIICIIMNLLALTSLGMIIYIVRDIRRMRRAVIPMAAKSKSLRNALNPLKKWQRFQLFFIGSKETSLVQQIFMFPYLLRFYIFYSVIAYLFEHPLTQAILITLLTMLILSYILWKKPFTSKLVFIQHTSDETIMLVVNICILALAICDRIQLDEDSNLRETLGDIIIYANLLICVTSNVYLVAYLLTGFKSAYEKCKKYKSQGLLAWLTAFLAPFESGGMDVDVLPDEEEQLPSRESPPKTQASIAQAVRSYMDILGSPHSSSTSLNDQVLSKNPMRRKRSGISRIWNHAADSGLDPEVSSSSSLSDQVGLGGWKKNFKLIQNSSTGVDSDVEAIITPQSSSLLTIQLRGNQPLWKKRTLNVLRKNLGSRSPQVSTPPSGFSSDSENPQNSFMNGGDFVDNKVPNPHIFETSNIKRRSKLSPLSSSLKPQSPSNFDSSLSIIKHF